MDINILQREFDELRENPALFDPFNFKVRKEALDFIEIITKFRSREPFDWRSLQEQAQELGEELQRFNDVIAEEFLARLLDEKPSSETLLAWLQPYTDYVQGSQGRPHYGYESLDFLLDEILLPQPQPMPSRPPEYGMVRYEATPASVMLELTERVRFAPNDVFYDLGAGLGKVTALIHLLTGARCVGVEYQPSFCNYARQQAKKLGLDGVTYLNNDARHVDYADGSVFFLFNPFGGVIFDTVLEKLHGEAQKRVIRVCSYGSSSEPLAELPWLEKIPPNSGEELALMIFQSHG
jgi:hypothetical protein